MQSQSSRQHADENGETGPSEATPQRFADQQQNSESSPSTDSSDSTRALFDRCEAQDGLSSETKLERLFLPDDQTAQTDECRAADFRPAADGVNHSGDHDSADQADQYAQDEVRDDHAFGAIVKFLSEPDHRDSIVRRGVDARLHSQRSNRGSGKETAAEHLRNALAILTPAISDYTERGDDPAALWSIEQVGHDIVFAARRITQALEALQLLERQPDPTCPQCTANHTPSVMVVDQHVLRCVWCGHELAAGAR